MATVDSITLSQGQQLDAERQLDGERLKSKQQASINQTSQRHKRQLQAKKIEVLSPTQVAETAAKQGYVRIWQWAQEALEDLALSFADFMVFTGPLVMLLYVTRMVFGTILKGGPTIRYKEFSMPLIPSYGVTEGFYRTTKFVFIAAITSILYSAILIGGFVITHPGQAAQFAFLNSFCWLSQFFGNQC